MIIISYFFSCGDVFIRRRSTIGKYIFVPLVSEFFIFFFSSTAPARRAIRPNLSTSKASAKLCFQRYFAAAGVIFQ